MPKPYKIGYVAGTYDLFHIGHLNLFRRAKERCDYLIVGVVNDELSVHIKGKRPYIPFDERIALVRACRYVDEAVEVSFANSDKIAAWHQLHYDCHFSGDDHANDWGRELAELRALGANMEFFPYTQSTSSTQIQRAISRDLAPLPLYSFDLFDTLITRDTATPRGIFAIMQAQLQHERRFAPWLCDNFYDLRLDAERMAYLQARSAKFEEISLDGIYRALRLTGLVNGQEAEELMAMERATELRHVRPVAANLARLKSLLRDGKRVVLISDMYLDAPSIRQMLRKVDPELARLPLYLSSECGGSKENGRLFAFVREREHADYATWTHFGDNERIDVNAAHALGIVAVHLPAEPLRAHELSLVDAAPEEAFVQLSVGASRNLRLDRAERPGWFDIGAGMGALLLVPYVRWLLAESVRRGFRHLYFIARDGFVLKRIADAVIASERLDLATTYLYGSRRAWRLPCLAEPQCNLSQLVWISFPHEIHTLEQFATVFGLAATMLAPFLPPTCREPSHTFTRDEVMRLAAELNGNAGFLAELRRQHQGRRELALAYLRQEIDFREPFAFVELQGSGFTQGCLAQLCGNFTPRRMTTFFLTLWTHPEIDYQYDKLIYYLGDRNEAAPLEILCRATHGATLGYAERDGSICPVLDDSEGSALIQRGYDSYVNGLTAYTAALQSALSRSPWLKPISLRSYQRLLDHLMLTPDVDLLNFLGDMPYEVIGNGEATTFAPQLTDEQLRGRYLDGKSEAEVGYTGAMWKYSLLRGGEAMRQAVERYEREAQARREQEQREQAAKWAAERAAALERDRRELSARCERRLSGAVVLYGAGQHGRRLREILLALPRITLALWADKQYRRYRNEGLDVVAPEDIAATAFDWLLIGVRTEQVAQSIRAELVALGVPAEKLVWLSAAKD